MPPPTSQPRKPDTTAAASERNQYIPSFIANKPFYVADDDGSGADYLDHQRLQKQADDSLQNSKWYDRGAKQGPRATKFRKGACENCGAMTHKTKECLSRPRKAGARWTGKDIQADEVVQDVSLGWDAKRDRWNGYNAGEYQVVVDEYNELETLKKAQLPLDENEEGDRYEEGTEMGREQAKGTRNLRLREDTAKYLLNLDLDSAKYDPKTRSLVDAGASADQAAALVAEEGFVRKSGDAAAFERAQMYAWETQESGDRNKLHLQANPTEGELKLKKQTQETEQKRSAQRKALLEKYGGEEHLKAAPLKDTLVTESERYVEYDEDGGIKGAPKTKPKSKYLEDVYINNHTSVWGSWWKDFKWGYACCYSTVKNSYCTGDAGKEALEEEIRRKAGLEMDEVGRSIKAIEAPPESEDVEDTRDIEAESSKRKRTLEEMRDSITEQDMEEYRRKRTNANDPMARMLGKDELVH
jgi:pre-mRNA-processing factor SLU7